MNKIVTFIMVSVVLLFGSSAFAEKEIGVSTLPWGITPSQAIESLKATYGEENVEFSIYIYGPNYTSKDIHNDYLTITPDSDYSTNIPSYYSTYTSRYMKKPDYVHTQGITIKVSVQGLRAGGFDVYGNDRSVQYKRWGCEKTDFHSPTKCKLPNKSAVRSLIYWVVLL